MDTLETTRNQLNTQLDELVPADPLAALNAIGDVQRDVAARRGAAVRIAVQRHTWSEIGSALGVSKQAAHQKFAKEWAETLKNELKAVQREYKAATSAGDARAAGEAARKRVALVEELKGASRKWK